jgi:pimeloyl-ACP methyl ester carboxylesterase
MTYEKLYKQTSRRKIAYYRMGESNPKKLILIHGNVSSSSFYLPIMKRLCDEYDIVAPDLNGYGDTEPSPINAETGLNDWAMDIDSLAKELGFERFSLLGWSLGGGVAMKYAIEYSEKLENLLLISPMSPFGFGGTYDEDGKMIDKKGLGCAGGFVNPDFLAMLIKKDKSDAENTARTTMRKSYFKAGFMLDKDWEDLFVDEILKMQIGPDYYPGDYKKIMKFPFVLPKKRGTNNSLAPQYANASAIADIENKPQILWFRGDSDILVSDNSLADLAVLGKMGVLPNYPGEEKFPPQPMVSQTRFIFEKYKSNGGEYKEFVIKDAGHSCHLEKKNEFVQLVKENIK